MMLLREKSNNLHRTARISRSGLQVASPARERAPREGKSLQSSFQGEECGAQQSETGSVLVLSS